MATGSVRTRGTGRGHHQLRALVQPVAAVVQRVDRGAGLEVQVPPPIDPLQHVAEEVGHVADVQLRIVFAGHDQQVLGQRQLPLAQQGVAQREQLPRPLPAPRRARNARCRRPAAAGARPPPRRRAPPARRRLCLGITGPTSSWINWPNIESSCGGRPTTVNGQIGVACGGRPAPRSSRGNRGPGCSSPGGRRKGPRAVGALGLDVAADAEVGLGVDRQLVGRRQIMGTRRPPRAPAKASSLRPSGSGITAATVMAGGPPTKTFTRSGFLQFARPRRGARRCRDGSGSAARPRGWARSGLPRNLHAIHAQVGMRPGPGRRGLPYRPAAR